MTDPKEKTGPKVPTRTPKKKTPGIFDNLRKMPQPHPVEEMLGLVSPAKEITPSTPSTPSSTPQNSEAAKQSARKAEPETEPSIAPERDFMRFANSIIREAVPSGIFGGKSKQLYDYLYSLTRGAIVPRRTVRISKQKLMKGAGIGSEVTLRTNLAKLSSTGLVIERVYPGNHKGNEYEVFLPEELEQEGAKSPLPLYPLYPLYPLQKLEGLDPLETRGSRGGLIVEDKQGYGKTKTFFKTNTEIDDDFAAFGLFARVMQEAAKEVTGRQLTAAEKERFGELAELLVTELKIAAARTQNVSSVPAFLTEHLRRRLWRTDKRAPIEETRGKSSEDKRGLSAEEARKCPDCGGSGMYYPEGYEKGVARCRHERLERRDGAVVSAEAEEQAAAQVGSAEGQSVDEGS